MTESLWTPKEIGAALEKRVVGQPVAVREISIALSKRIAGVGGGNVLMIGSSGSGKTTLMRAVEDFLAAQPQLADRSTVLRIHANVLAQEAERGRPGEAVLRGLLGEARRKAGQHSSLDDLLNRVRRGIVFVDEIDKIRSWLTAGEANPAGIRAQEGLLTLIENEAVPFDLPEQVGGGHCVVDSRDILFVAAGAFEGLYDSVYNRVTIGSDRGSLKPVTTVEGGQVHEELPFQLGDWLRSEDLFAYGMSPQFLSRFESIVLFRELGAEELVRVLLENADSAYRRSREFFARFGVDLVLSPAAIELIAQEARRQKRIGARALNEVFRRVIRGYESEPGRGSHGQNLLIDEKEVRRALDPDASRTGHGAVRASASFS